MCRRGVWGQLKVKYPPAACQAAAPGHSWPVVLSAALSQTQTDGRTGHFQSVH